jgi:hypothetical protein
LGEGPRLAAYPLSEIPQELSQPRCQLICIVDFARPNYQDAPIEPPQELQVLPVALQASLKLRESVIKRDFGSVGVDASSMQMPKHPCTSMFLNRVDEAADLDLGCGMFVPNADSLAVANG